MTEKDSLYPIQLIDTRLFEVSVERKEPSREPEESTPSLEVALNVREQGSNHLIARLELDVKGRDADDPEFEICISTEGLFESSANLNELEEDVLEDFQTRVAYALLWPYVREYLHSLAQRMRVEIPLLPTLNVMALRQLQAEAQEMPSD